MLVWPEAAVTLVVELMPRLPFESSCSHCRLRFTVAFGADEPLH